MALWNESITTAKFIGIAQSRANLCFNTRLLLAFCNEKHIKT
jgi:hypothetical protein